MTTIHVPATSANLGPGFDSLGLALTLDLAVTIGQPQTHWQIDHQLGRTVANNQDNLIVKTALALIPDLTPHYLHLRTNIPFACGLGSHSALIIAGIELADYLGKLSLSQFDKLQLATKLKGHPDNVAPAIYGGFVAATYDGFEAEIIQTPFPPARILAYIPPEQLSAQKSRGVLPAALPLRAAVASSSAANVLVGALFRGDLELAGRMLERDQFHETYRRRLAPNLVKIRHCAAQAGAYGTYLSGSGPAILSLVPPKQASTILATLMQLHLPGHWLNLTAAPVGVTVSPQ